MTEPRKESSLSSMLALVCAILALLMLFASPQGSWLGTRITALLGQGRWIPVPLASLFALGLAAALLLTGRETRWRRLLVWALMGACLAGSLVSLAGHLLGIATPLEAWLATGGHLPLGRTQVLLDLTVLLLSSAQALMLWSRRGTRQAASLVILGNLVIAGVMLIGHAAGAAMLYDTKSMPMSMGSAVNVLLLGGAILGRCGTDAWPLALFQGRGGDGSRGGRWYLRVSLLIFLLLSLAILASGVLYLRAQLKAAQSTARENLLAISEMKSSQIQNWYQERTADMAMVHHSKLIQDPLQECLAGKVAAKASMDVETWMRDYCREYGYKGVALFDADGRMKACTQSLQGFVPEGADLRRAVASMEVCTTDLHRNGSASEIHLDFWVPVGAEPGAKPKEMGTLLFRLDGRAFLFPLIQAWPGVSASAETLLVRKEGNEVVYLNELRHRAGTALKMRFPVGENPELPADMAVSGKEGFITGRDYRGVSVLAVTKAVLGTPWFMITKVDEAEIYAPLRRMAWISGLAILSLISGVALVFGLQARHHDARILREKLDVERELKSLAERFEHLMRQASDIILMLDGQGHILEANARALDSYGYTLPELQRLSLADLHPPGEAGPLLEELARAGSLRTECVQRRRDASTFPVELSATKVSIGEETFLVFSGRDITERNQIEQALRTSEQRYALTLDAVNDGFWDWHVPSGNAFFSARYYAILGYEDGDFPATYASWRLLVHPEDLDRVESELQERVASGEGFAIDLRMRTKSGEWRWVSTRGKTVERDAEGRALRLLGTLSDITERKRAEEEIQHLNAHLEDLVQERTAQLEQSNKELEGFCYSVSHDLRAPLRGIDGFSLALAEDFGAVLNQEGQHYLHRIRLGAQRMGRLIDDLLTLSRLTRRELEFREVDLSARARITLEELREQEPERRVEWTVEDGILVQGDGNLLQVVLENLLENAWKFTSTQSLAHISFGREILEDGRTAYVVKDNGVGFDPTYMHKLFGVFQRLHAAHEFPGNGVGLASVQRIIKRHGGEVWAHSSPGEGASFSFTLNIPEENHV